MSMLNFNAEIIEIITLNRGQYDKNAPVNPQILKICSL